VRVSDVYWNYDVVKLMDGCRESYLLDHSFVFSEVQEAFHRHIVSFCAIDVVAGHELYSF